MKLKKKALRNTKKGNSPSLDNIPPELLKEDINYQQIYSAIYLKEFGNRKKITVEGIKCLLFKLPKKGNFLTVQIGEELHYFL
jgi:hypothetical protein